MPADCSSMKLSAMLLGLIWLVAPNSSEAEPSPPKPVTKARIDQILIGFDRYVEKSRLEWEVPSVAVAVVLEDQVVWWKGYGDRGKSVAGPPDLKTVYAIGSTTKAFCAATLAKMVDEGHFTWDSRVVDDYPSFRMADPWVTREMRVSDLLAQHSGMPMQSLSLMAAMGYSREEVIQAMGWVEPVTSFRAHYAYVNSPHLVAGKMVAQSCGTKTWEDALNRILLKPLRMNRTTWTEAGLDSDPNRAPGHARVEGQIREIKAGPFPYVFGPAGGLNSCLDDMSHWVRMQLHDGTFEGTPLISEQNLAVTRAPQTVLSDDVFYCMGWLSHVRKNHRVIWHNGGTPGHTTWVGIQPEHKLGLIVLSNLGGTQMPDAVGLKFFSLVHDSDEVDYSTVFKKRHEQSVAETPDEAGHATIPPPDASRLTGDYHCPALGKMHISSAGAGLAIRFLRPDLEARLVHLDGAAYQIRHEQGWLADIGWSDGGSVRFTQTEAGEYDAIDLHLGESGEGATFRAERVSQR